MPDLEKVIKGLNSCSGSDPCVNSCPYYDNCGNNYSCTSNLAKDVLAVLKELKDGYKNILSDYEDLAREHEKLLDKTIPLITNGQEVIRCKDCKYWNAEEHDCNIKIGWFSCGADWYCADGERRAAE